MTTRTGSTRTPRRTGSTAVSAADLDPVGAALAAEAAVQHATVAHEKERARTAASRVKDATGWACAAGTMSLTCTRDGHVPLIVHRSTLDEAADVAISLLGDGTDRTLRHTAGPGRVDVDSDAGAQPDQGTADTAA